MVRLLPSRHMVVPITTVAADQHTTPFSRIEKPWAFFTGADGRI
jgi:hypothetical protein